MNYLKLWCEYDYGHEDILFTSHEQGKKWLVTQMRSVDGNDWLESEFPGGIEQVFKEGLAGFTIMAVCED